MPGSPLMIRLKIYSNPLSKAFVKSSQARPPVFRHLLAGNPKE
jgi:hypothetical protein